jgi:hypothetical protein
MKGRVKVDVTDEYLAKEGHTRESYEKLSRAGRWSVRNREKHYAICKKTIAKNPQLYSTRHRKYELNKKYNLTEEEYNQMLINQGGCCAICGTNKPTGKWKVFAVDHNHETGQVRELLCNECNRGIGLLKDDPERLLKAAEYLLKHDVKTQNERNGKTSGS